MTRGACALALILMLAAGCGIGPPSEAEMNETRAMLAQRPSSEQITARYEQMLTDIRARLDSELGPYNWVNRQDSRTFGCTGDFARLGGVTHSLDRWTHPDAIPDDQWPRAVRIVAEVTGQYGFGEPNTIVDRPGDHEISGYDNYGASYQFGTKAATVLAAITNCHFPEADLPVIRSQLPPP